MADLLWRGCVVPEDLLYDVGLHVWVRLDGDAGDTAVLGMTDVAQTMGGRIVQVSWKKTGRSYARGRSLAVIESAKWVGPFPTPLTGELVEVNEPGFAADIAIANRDPNADVADFYADLTIELARFRDLIEGCRRCNHDIGRFTCAEAPPNLRSSGKIYGDCAASLLAEGVGGYDKSRLYCARAKHVDLCRECRKGKYKRHKRDKQPVPHCPHLAALKKGGALAIDG